MEEEVKTEETMEDAKPESKEEVKQETKEEVKDEVVEEKPLDKMTAPELREVAKQIPGVTGATAMKKDELLSIIKEFRGIKDDEPVKKKKVTKAGKVLNIKELKAKIAQLKGEKAAAQEAKDDKKIDIYRRRINRLKKMTRKIARG